MGLSLGKPLALVVAVVLATTSLAHAADAPALPVQIAPNDPSIRFIGRFDLSQAQPELAWSGTTIQFVFNGTDANILLLDGAPGGAHSVAGNNDNYFDFIVDTAPAVDVSLESGTTVYRVASGLDPGDHTVTIYKRTEASVGKVTFQGLQLSTGGTLKSPPATKDRHIEFIGDSITAGYGDEATDKNTHFSPSTENNYLAYSGLSAQWLGADYSILAWSGIGAYIDYNGSTAEQMPVRWLTTIPTDDNSPWDFSRWSAGAVVINLGTNDISHSDPGYPFVEAYLGLLHDVRARYPFAPIFVCLGPVLTGTQLSSIRGYLQSAMTTFKDSNTFFVEFPQIDPSEGYGADGHPSLQTHQRMASQLVHEIRVRTGWEWTPPADGGFVRVEGQHLTLNGGYFYFSGANSYSLLYSELDAEEQFKIAKSLGLNAIRFWGFWNGEDASGINSDQYGHTTLQPRPGVFPEDAWQKFDYVVYLAHVYGIKLIVTLNNEWNEFGGLNEYLEWAGYDLPPIPQGHYAEEDMMKPWRTFFWTDATCKELYKAYVRHTLERVNTYTGVAYKDDPAIMIWELSNEPRFGTYGADPDATAVGNWLAEMAEYIKSLDSSHLVASGEEGFLMAGENSLGRSSYPWTAGSGEGVSFTANSEIPSIDVLTIHAWPFQWNIIGEYPDLSTFIPEWLDAHLALAQKAGKPMYLGEFGWQILRQPGSDVPDRDKIMKAAYDHAAGTDISGVAVWEITSSHDPSSAVYSGPITRSTLVQAIYDDTVVPNDEEFLFDIFCPEDVSTCNLIESFTTPMVKKVEFPDPPYVKPCLSPWTTCGDVCVLLDSHPAHCGDCNTACQTGEECYQGKCVALGTSTAPDNSTVGCSMASGGTTVGGWFLVMLIAGIGLRARSARRPSPSLPVANYAPERAIGFCRTRPHGGFGMGQAPSPERSDGEGWGGAKRLCGPMRVLPTVLVLLACLLSTACLKLRRPIVPESDRLMDTKDHYQAPEVPESSEASANFVLEGKPLCFSGANNYYLTYKSSRMVDDVFRQAKALDLKVLRLWAFTDRGSLDGSVVSVDGDGTKDGVYFQYWDTKAGKPAYNDGANGLKKLDYVVHKARETGIKLILVFTNNWSDFGGMDQYLVWYGLSKHHQFYTDERARKAYKDYVQHVITRRNSIDYMLYSKDPAILAWELANEPRCKNHEKFDSVDGWDNTTLTNWAREMSDFVKSIDPNHLVAVGDEGVFAPAENAMNVLREPECLDHQALLALPSVDFGTFHLYPETYGAGFQFGNTWVEDHVKAAQRAGKPTILEEYGIRVKRDEKTLKVSQLWQRREAAYLNWNNYMLRKGGNAALFWMLAGADDSGGLYPDHDHYNVYAGAETAKLLQDYARRYNSEATACKRMGAAPAQTAFVGVSPPQTRQADGP